MNKKVYYAKILLILVMSVWISSFVGSNVFISYTPRIRNNPGVFIVKRVKNQINNFVAKLNLPFGDKSSQTAMNPVPINDNEAKSIVEQTKAALINAPLKTVAKGIYAQENGQTSMTIINTGEVESVKLTYVVDGQTVILTIPKTYYDSLGLSDEELIDQASGGQHN